MHGQVVPDRGVSTTEATWLVSCVQRFYDFEGLERFKAKLAPHDWEPIYAISNEERFSPRTLYAVAAAFTGGSPVIVVLKGMGRALRQEWEWLRHGRRV